jgi:aspartate kinase
MKVTDLLYLLQAHIKFNAPFDDIFDKIKERYVEIKESCGLKCDLDYEFEVIASGLNKKTSVDHIVSRGEYLNARLMAEYLGYTFVDSASWLVFNYNGKVNFEKSYENLATIVEHTPHIVIPGFYGAMPDGAIKTFSRGGSDITGAIAAAAVNADMYENWTDVSGIMTADPRIVDNPRPIENVTFAELRELSYMGAEVLHEQTVFPVRQANIPLYIKNTNDPAAKGTLVMESFSDESEEEKSRFITGISGKKHYSIITICKNRMSEDLSFLRRVLEITEKHHLPVEHIPSSIDSISLVIATKYFGNNLHALLADIQSTCNPDSIKVSDGISLVAVVGRRMVSETGVSGKIFATLGQAGINIRIIEQGSDEINVIVGVMDSDFKDTIRTLYNSFT